MQQSTVAPALTASSLQQPLVWSQLSVHTFSQPLYNSHQYLRCIQNSKITILQWPVNQQHTQNPLFIFTGQPDLIHTAHRGFLFGF